ncbi:hypothetical protein PLESTB_001337100 [Pleodorina starrii]|uniref:Protein kinase domain-containing protein n=1 Tax=Pleodorina starrii TaxID=330485 RepID=A0A9W6F6M2_9CHLO|nr:hypothetical protein PLESTB_001337100 [Pleodorina starrii]GLC66409.1 hypothetical protein PLESTF_000424300 [Pleodorina starrii]
MESAALSCGTGCGWERFPAGCELDQAALLWQQAGLLNSMLRMLAGFMGTRSLLTSDLDTSANYTAIAEAATSVADAFNPEQSSSADLLAKQAHWMRQSLEMLANMMRISAAGPQGGDATVLSYADGAAEFADTFTQLLPPRDDGSSSAASSSCGGSPHCSAPTTSTTFSDSTTTTTVDSTDSTDSDVDIVVAALRSSASTAVLPVLNPYSPPPSGAKRLHAPSEDTNTSVWRATLGGSSGICRSSCDAEGRQQEALVLKVVPFHSPEVAARLEQEGDSFHTGSGEVAEVLLEEEACHEALTAVAVAQANARYVAAAAAAVNGGASVPVAHEIYAQPQLMAVQECPLRGGPQDLGHDRQLVVGFKYFGAGNAAEYLCNRATQLIRDVAGKEVRPVMTRGSAATPLLAPAAVELIGEGLAREVNGMALSMYGMMGRMHELGFLINDLKLENMVYDTDVADFRFIDAEAVRRCRLGEKLPGVSKHTEYTAAPEQQLGEAEAWSDSFSDVYAGGASMREALAICLDVCGNQLGRGEAFGAVKAAFLARVGPLRDLMARCTAAEAGERPSAADVLQQLHRHRLL